MKARLALFILALFGLPSCGSTPDKWVWRNPLPQGNSLHAIWALNAATAVAVGGAGTILRWNGESWTAQDSGTTETLNGIWGSADDAIWAVGSLGSVLKWNGIFWAPQPVGTKTDLWSIWGTDANNIWVSASDGSIVNGDYDPPIRTYTDPRMEMSCQLPTSPT